MNQQQSVRIVRAGGAEPTRCVRGPPRPQPVIVASSESEEQQEESEAEVVSEREVTHCFFLEREQEEEGPGDSEEAEVVEEEPDRAPPRLGAQLALRRAEAETEDESDPL